MKQYNKISKDIIYAAAIIAFVGLFVVANYFFGFSLSLYVVTMAIGAILAIRFPRAGLYAVIFLTFIFERFFTLAPIVMGRSEYKLYPIDVLLGALLLGTFFQILTGSLKLKLKKIDLAVIAFIALSMIYFLIATIFLKSDTALAFSTAKNYAFYSLLYFATYILINSKQHLKEMATVIFAGAIGILWFVFYGIAARHGLWSDFTPLSTEGIRTLAFTHAFYLCMAIIIALVYMAYESDKFSKWLMFLAPIWMVGIIGSMMRHLWISLFVAVIFLIVMFTRAQRKRLQNYALIYALTALCVVAILAYGATLFPRSGMYAALSGGAGMVQNRIVSITDTSGDESIVWRSAVWQQAMRQYAGNPIFGIGFGKLIPVEIGDYHDFVEVRDVHNSFLVLLIQMGIVGFALIAVLLAILGWPVLKNKFKDDFVQALAYATLGILALQIVAFVFQPYLEANLLGIFFWINLGVLRRIYENIGNQQIL